MLADYVPILLLVGVALGFALLNNALSELFGRKRKNIGKADAYECGMEPRGSARIRLSIHFYLIAVLFILFDVEAVFLFLWAVSAEALRAQDMAMLVLYEIGVFVFVLVLALAYVWRKGGLEWDR
ncbi:MAG: NADH-quinone oxidoreductase subunit A [Planctomycetes bacterium]|nr:NADH-quinone oxidoreductase subunit A [Planctomycetota bacterium]